MAEDTQPHGIGAPRVTRDAQPSSTGRDAIARGRRGDLLAPRLVRVLVAVIAVTSAACGYDASFGDCTIGCSDNNCPNNYTCGVEGLCRASGSTKSCVDVLSDAGIGLDSDELDAPFSIDGNISGGSITLQQTNDNVVSVGSGVTCGNNAAGYTSANSWYRVFSPVAFGVSGVFHVQHVDFAAQEASAGDTVKVSVGTYAGAVGAATLNTAQMTPLVSNISVPVGATSTGEPLAATTTVDIPAGSNMYVQIDSPDYSASGTQYFYIGASAGGETTAGYILAPVCSVNTPEKLTTASATAGALILTVTGTY